MKNWNHRKQSFFLRIGILILIVVSLWIRMIHFHSLYPYFFYQDELRHSRICLDLIQKGTFKPDFYLYPHLTIYLTSFVYTGYFLTQKFPEVISKKSLEPVKKFGQTFDEKNWTLLRIARGLSLGAGMVSVFTFFLLARRLLGAGWGLACAFLFSLFPLSVSFSALAKVDIYMICFQLLSWLFQVRILQQGKNRDYLLAGAFAGLCFDCKINFFPGISYLLTVLLRAHQEKIKTFLGIFHQKTLLGIFACGATALLASPFYFFNLEEAIKNVGWIYYSTEWVPYWHFDPHNFWRDRYYYSILVLIPSMVSVPVWLLALVGLFQKVIKNDFQEWFLLMSCFFAFLFAFDSSAGSYLYYLYFYLLPLIALFSVLVLRDLFISGGILKKILASITLGMLLIISLSRFQFYHQLNFQAFEIAGSYMAKNLKPGSKVLSFSVYLPGPSLEHLQVEPAWPQDLSREMIEKKKPDYILIDRWNFAGFEKFYRDQLPIRLYLQELLKGQWEYQLVKRFVISYPGDSFYQWLDPEFLVELDLLERKN